MLYFYVKYSTGWGPPIGWCRSETDLPRPNLTNFDVFFCKKYPAIRIREDTSFFGPHSHFFGPGAAHFFNSLVFSENWGAPLNIRKSSFIKGAANCQRTAVNFAGKCRLVRRGGEWAAGEAWKWWKYTNTPQIRIRIHRERQEIHKYKNTNTHKYKYYYWQSEPDQKRKKMRFSEKVFAQKWL